MAVNAGVQTGFEASMGIIFVEGKKLAEVCNLKCKLWAWAWWGNGSDRAQNGKLKILLGKKCGLMAHARRLTTSTQPKKKKFA